MNNDPYAAPTTELQAEDAAIQTLIWSAKGRLGRLSYLAQMLVTLVISIGTNAALLFLINSAAGGTADLNFKNLDHSLLSSPVKIAVFFIVSLLMLAYVYLYACATIKRLHDRNHSGWWSLPILVLAIIPIIGLIGLSYVLFFPGNKHVNQFGGKRATKVWEKTLSILFIVVFLVAGIYLGVTGSIWG